MPEKSRLGLPAAIALVLGTIVGTGIFTAPAALASYGTVSLIALVVVTLGALALAVVFGRLSKRLPRSGGPYVYASDAFGPFAGFLTAWSYWISGWAGNAGIAVAWVGYVNEFVPVLDSRVTAVGATLVGIWLPALVVLSGVRNLGGFQVVTTAIKFAALLLVGVIGLFFVKSANFGPFNATDGSWWGALSAAGAVLLFSYIGVESAAIVAGVVRDPSRNIGRATILGTLAAALIYILGIVTVFGTVGQAKLRESTAPFADAVDDMFGGTAGGYVMAAAAVISGLGALTGWTLVTAELSYGAARDGVFPTVFTRTRRDVAWVGVLVAAVLTSILVITNFTGGLNEAFERFVLLTSFTVTIPYLLSASAQLLWLLTRGRRPARPFDFVAAGGAIAFALWMVLGSGYSAVYSGLFLVLLGVPIYVWMRSTGQSGDQAAPGDGSAAAGGRIPDGRR